MRALIIFLIGMMPLIALSSQNLKPYILGFETSESLSETKAKLVSNIEANGLQIVGQYKPASDNNRWLIIFTCNELKNSVKTIGGLTGFASTLRIAITQENDKTLVSYTNPLYWGTAYFRNDYDKVASNYSIIVNKITKVMVAGGTYKGTPFGSDDGHSTKTLKKYHYMLGMPYFENTVELASFSTHSEAVAKIDQTLKSGVPNVKQVYKTTIPSKEIALYGFALSGEEGESQFLPIIDIGQPKHTAFLPYEVLVIHNEVHMLHGRFRIALSFPDLTMATFTKIMSTPGNIESLLEQIVQ